MFNKKPRLLKNSTPEETPDSYRSPLAASDDVVVETTKTSISTVLNSGKRGIKAVIATVIFAFSVIAIVYVSLSATLMFAAPTDTGIGERTWVARGTFVGGQPDAGSFIYGSASASAPKDILKKTVEGFVGAPDYFIAEVVTGPHDKISNDKSDNILVNGDDSGYDGAIEKGTLVDQYLAVCVEGNCGEAGELVTIASESISGEAKGKIFPFGMSNFTSFKGQTDDNS